MTKAWYFETRDGGYIKFSSVFAKALGFKGAQEVDISIDEMGNLVISPMRDENDLKEIRNITRKLICKYSNMLRKMSDE